MSGISEEERLPLPRPRSRALSLPGGCRLRAAACLRSLMGQSSCFMFY